MTEVLANHTIDITVEPDEETKPEDYVSRLFVGFYRWPIDSGYQEFIKAQLTSKQFDNCLLELCDAILAQGKGSGL